jgi:hypothetical protein
MGARAKLEAKAFSMSLGEFFSKSILDADALLEKTQRTNARSTKVSLLFWKARDSGHYAAEVLSNEELERRILDIPTSDVRLTISALVLLRS